MARFATHDVLVSHPKRRAGRNVRELVAVQFKLLRHHLHMHATAPMIQASARITLKIQSRCTSWNARASSSSIEVGRLIRTVPDRGDLIVLPGTTEDSAI